MSSPGLEALEGVTLASKYKLLSLLGSGGMGYVYRAEQLGLRRSVAVKLLRPSKLTKTNLDLFRSEALAASRINHPNAVAIYDFGVTDDGTPFLVMEHLRGDTLATMVERTAFATDRIIAIGAQVLSALHEAHSCSVIHCDLTSDNVIVERLRDGDDFAKVIDFGLASALDNKIGGNAIVGTPEYMAPEQITGGAITPAVDIYAMGALLYEMIVGRTPFAGGTIRVVLQGHLHATPSSPIEIIPTCPPALAELVLSALAKNPADRPPTALHMRDALLTILEAHDDLHPRPVRAHATGDRDPTPPPRLHSRPPSQEMRIAHGSRTSISVRRSTRLSWEINRKQPLLVGREPQLEQLIKFAQGGGVGNSLAVAGPAGVGKARLVMAAAAHLQKQVPVFFAGSDPAGQKLSWYPILSLLEGVLGLTGEVSVNSLSQAVARAGLPERDVPGLAEIFALRGPASDLELAARRREAHAAARRVLLSLGRRYPRALLCFADVDRYDEPSKLVVQSIAEAIDKTSMRLILTTRDLDVAPPATNVIELEAFASDTSLEMMCALMGLRAQAPPAELVQEITSGSPAAIEQLAGWLLMGNSAASAPTSLVDLVSLRFHRMPAGARQVLQAIAVHGNVAPRWLVEQTLATPAEIDVSTPVWTGMAVSDDDMLTIPSELVANVVNACMPADVKRRMHSRALQALDTHAPHCSLGRHAELAGNLEDAFGHYVAAGTDAVDRFDDDGAAAHYRSALHIAKTMPTQHTNRRVRCADAGVMLADVLFNSGELEAAKSALGEVEASYGPNDSQLAAMEHTRGRIAMRERRLSVAVDHLQRAIGIAMRCGDRDRLCVCYPDLSRALFKKGEPQHAIDELEQAIDVITAGQGLPVTDGPDRLWFLAHQLAERYLEMRDVHKARRMAEGALAQAQRIGSARGRGRMSALLARIYDTAGQRSAALRHRANAIDVLRELGDRRSTAELLLEDVRATRAGTDAGTSREVAARGLRMAKKLAAEVEEL